MKLTEEERERALTSLTETLVGIIEKTPRGITDAELHECWRKACEATGTRVSLREILRQFPHLSRD